MSGGKGKVLRILYQKPDTFIDPAGPIPHHKIFQNHISDEAARCQ